jgi:hypothetical protein
MPGRDTPEMLHVVAVTSAGGGGTTMGLVCLRAVGHNP